MKYSGKFPPWHQVVYRILHCRISSRRHCIVSTSSGGFATDLRRMRSDLVGPSLCRARTVERVGKNFGKMAVRPVRIDLLSKGGRAHRLASIAFPNRLTRFSSFAHRHYLLSYISHRYLSHTAVCSREKGRDFNAWLPMSRQVECTRSITSFHLVISVEYVYLIRIPHQVTLDISYLFVYLEWHMNDNLLKMEWVNSVTKWQQNLVWDK